MGALLKLIMIVIMIMFGNMKTVNTDTPKKLVSEHIIVEGKTFYFTSYNLYVGRDSNQIIKTKEEFNNFIKQLKKEEKQSDSDTIQVMKNTYDDFDFATKSLVIVDASGSGCSPNINFLEKVFVEGNTVNISLDDDEGATTCQAFWAKTYIIEVEKGHYNKIVVN